MRDRMGSYPPRYVGIASSVRLQRKLERVQRFTLTSLSVRIEDNMRGLLIYLFAVFSRGRRD